jgi:hypothetical protein
MVLAAVLAGEQGSNLRFSDVGEDAQYQPSKEVVRSNLRSWLFDDDRVAQNKSGTSVPDGLMAVVRDTPSYGLARLRNIRLIELKYCRDTDFQQTLQTMQDQHANLLDACTHENCSSPKDAPQLVRILLGACGTIYEEHTILAIKSLGVKGKELQELLTELRRHSVRSLHAIAVACYAGTAGHNPG